MTAAPLAAEAALFHRLLRRTRRHKLSLGGIQLLTCLMLEDSRACRMTDAARTIGVSGAALTEIADSLAAAGHITRRTCRSDRRVIHLHLTETGLAALTSILSA